MSLQINDQTLERRTNTRLRAVLAAEACHQALTAGVAARLEANFVQAQALRDANAYTAMAGNLYASIAAEEPDDIDLHPKLEAQLAEAAEKEIPL